MYISTICKKHLVVHSTEYRMRNSNTEYIECETLIYKEVSNT
jgi:hypothetical protein